MVALYWLPSKTPDQSKGFAKFFVKRFQIGEAGRFEEATAATQRAIDCAQPRNEQVGANLRVANGYAQY